MVEVQRYGISEVSIALLCITLVIDSFPHISSYYVMMH